MTNEIPKPQPPLTADADAPHWEGPGYEYGVTWGPEEAHPDRAYYIREAAIRDCADAVVAYCRRMNVAGREASFVDAHRAILALSPTHTASDMGEGDTRSTEGVELPWSNVGELAAWIEATRNKAFLNGARGDAISTVEATVLLSKLAALTADKPEAQGLYLVWSNEHQAWWGKDRCGYTRHIERAGRYERAEALSIAGTRDGGWHVRKGNPDEIAIPERDAVEQYVAITTALSQGDL